MAEGFHDSLMKGLLEDFSIEAKERLQALNDQLLGLEQAPEGPEAAGRLKAIFREAHTLKGTAAGLGLKDVEAIGHRLETIFGRFQSGQLASRPEVFDRIYTSLDAIGALVEQGAGGPLATAFNVAAICDDLDQIAEGKAPSGKQSEIAQPPKVEQTLHPSTQPKPPSADEPAPLGVEQVKKVTNAIPSADEEMTRALLASFDVEARERLQAVNAHLLAIERDPFSTDAKHRFESILRETHTLKGTARGLDLPKVEQLAHKIETATIRLQESSQSITGETFDPLYLSVDALGVLVREAVGVEPTSPIDLASIISKLDHVGVLAPVVEAQKTAQIQAASTVPATRSIAVEEVFRPTPPVAPAPVPLPTPAPMAETASAPKAERVVEETVRVTISKLDALMAQVGELQVTRIGAESRVGELTELLETLEVWESHWRKVRPEARRLLESLKGQAGSESRAVLALSEWLDSSEERIRSTHNKITDVKRYVLSDGRRMAQVAADLQEDVRRVRMLPISTVFEVFPRMVRDIARSLGKDVTLDVQGGENEMDRSVLEQVHGPLVHLIRNSVDHGLELPETRVAAGKPRRGTIKLSASQRGGSILVEISDDGGGIDLTKVRASAVRKGLLTQEAANALSDQEAVWLIFRSGFSTRTEVTDLSGRGVGLDVVRENVEKLGGLIDVETKLGQGSRFSVSLPLTVATTLCLLVEAGGQTFAVPVHNVVRLARVRPEQVGQAAGREVIPIDGRPLPITKLADSLDLPSPPRSGMRIAMILGSAESRIAFEIDAVLGAQEVVIKSLPKPFVKLSKLAGATILGTGQVVVILNVAELLRMATAGSRRPIVRQEPVKVAGPPEVADSRVVVVADDSFTTRSLIRGILESAGYTVRAAADGLEAWKLLNAGGCDMLVTDVEMPNMNGIELTMKVREHSTLKHLPVVLVTSLDSAEDRERGVKAGADAHIVKGKFDQESLLATVGRLV